MQITLAPYGDQSLAVDHLRASACTTNQNSRRVTEDDRGDAVDYLSAPILDQAFWLPEESAKETEPFLLDPYTARCGIRRGVRCIPTDMLKVLPHFLQVELVLGKVG